MNYIGIYCKVTPPEPFAEIIISQLGEIGFDMFEENEEGFEGYIIKEIFSEEKLKTINLLQPNNLCKATYTTKEIKSENWNQEWEKNFEPVHVKNVFIRAPFHPVNKEYEIEIIIQPKMSFGTGHHATTAMMVEHIFNINPAGKTVIDMGCGSGILGILAAKMGAKMVVGIDYDEVCIENATENINLNVVKNMKVELGTAMALNEKKTDILLANINRNILMQDVKAYAATLNEKGILVVSGFYEEDEDVITTHFIQNGLIKTNKTVLDKWCSLVFEKV